MKRRLCIVAGAAALLGGCTGLDSLTAEVRSFGDWPGGRAAGTYAFEHLPSQQAAAAEAEALERAARPALAQAGFVPAAEGQEPEVLVQLGARVVRTLRSPWDDPLWWSGGYSRWRRGPWVGPGWGWSLHLEPARYEHEVALLLRDRASGKPLYESRAAADSGSRADTTVVAAMYRAALVDFPRPALSPRQVTVALTPLP